MAWNAPTDHVWAVELNSSEFLSEFDAHPGCHRVTVSDYWIGVGTWSCICQISPEVIVGVRTKWKPWCALRGVGSVRLQLPNRPFLNIFWVDWELIFGKCWEKLQCYRRTGRSLEGRKSRLWNRKVNIIILMSCCTFIPPKLLIILNTFWYK